MKFETRMTLTIVNPNGTYLLVGSTFPVYVDDNYESFITEEYEKGYPCDHYLKDLHEDGIVFTLGAVK